MKYSTLHKGKFDGVLCFAGQDWWYHNRAHSDVQIMRNLAKHMPVLFINSVAMRMPRRGNCKDPLARIGRKIKSIAKGLSEVEPGMWVYSPAMLPPSKKSLMREINGKLMAVQICRALDAVGIKKWFTWITVPTASDIIEHMPTELIVFNRSDIFSHFPEADSDYIKVHERKLLCKSDIVLYVNKKLMSDDIGPADKKYYLGHGVDYDVFAAAADIEQPHPEISHLKRPVIGYFGQIDDYTIDIDLLETTARNLAEMSFVLIGTSTADIDSLIALPNVTYLGFRQYQQIPWLGASFDVAIMPWRQNQWMQNCNPIKLKEYLALGLPIVTTPFPQAQQYSNLLSIATNADQFSQAIRNCVSSKDDQLRLMRQKAVEQDSWQSKAMKVLELVEKVSEKQVLSV